MPTYLVALTDDSTTIEAADYTAGDGLVVFRDELGRAEVALPVERVVRIDVEYGPDDELWAARRRLVTAQRGELLESIEDELERITRPRNRAERRAR